MSETENVPDGASARPEGQPARKWETIAFLHIEPREAPSALPLAMGWVLDDRLGLARGTSSDDMPSGSGRLEFDLLDCHSLPRVVARMASVLGSPEVRVYSREPRDDRRRLGLLLEAGGWTGTIDVHDFSDCLVDESLELPRGKVDRETVWETASRLVAAARADHGIDRPSRAGAMVPAALWLTWKSLRAEVDNVAAQWMVQASRCYFWASRHGCHVQVGPASERELSALPAEADGTPWAGLEAWTLVALRDPMAATTVHALGRIEGTAEASITSPLAAADWAANVVTTEWGQSYRLSGPAQGVLDADLRAHLQAALEDWGYEHVRG